MDQMIHYLLHLDVFLAHFVQAFGVWAYVGLFLVVFLEMGCILTPFLPGDSLLFATGAIAATGALNIYVLIVSLFIACFSGIVINYYVGSLLGHKVAHMKSNRFINPKHLTQAHDFFEKYGGKTIAIACFLPIVRTFVPFVAGIVEMTASRLIVNALVGSFLWVVGLLSVSYLFGNIPFVKENFSAMVLVLIVLSLLIPAIGLLRKTVSKSSD
jgi:membrane-associated protein